MKILFTSLFLSLFSYLLFTSFIQYSSNTLKIDFGSEKDGQNWRVINDGVMGGLSQGNVTFNKNSVLFKGTVSLANNGGFSSFRAPYARQIDLSKFETVKIRLKSTGISCALTLNVNRAFYLPYFKQNLKPQSNDWETLAFNLTEFKQYRLLNATGNKAQAKDLQQIIRIGFITDEKKEGPFEIEIDYIEFK